MHVVAIMVMAIAGAAVATPITRGQRMLTSMRARPLRIMRLTIGDGAMLQDFPTGGVA
jgi:hypothetical protein